MKIGAEKSSSNLSEMNTLSLQFGRDDVPRESNYSKE
jgi:hypothetical protein